MSIRGFTRCMTHCPRDDFHWGLIPVAVLLVPLTLAGAVLFALAALFGVAATCLAGFMDFVADVSKLTLGVRLVEKAGADWSGTSSKKWNSFCSLLEWASAKLLGYA